MKNFEGFGLSPALTQSLAHMKYNKPTPIQAEAIPLALEGHDIMGSAQTGTGKTAAFAIPLVEKLLSNPRGSALVLTPTRELGKQIMDIMHQLLGPKSPIKTAFIIGGEAMGGQIQQLRARPRLIVGTPGRINDHLERGTMMLHDAHFLVLDETDRMLDMGFTVQLERIFKYMPEQRQTLMFSATLPDNILKLAEKFMNNPQRIAMGATNVVAQNIAQEVIRIDQSKKYKELQNQLEDRNGAVIVFVKTKYGADRMANNLRRDGFTSEALHGDLRQSKRDKVMRNFRKKNFRVLIATDVAARGLDVPHIEHVINYDLPQVAEDYIHRMGRTARAGAKGSAISFVSSQDSRKWHAIEMLLDPEAANDRARGSHNDNKNGKRSRRSGKKHFERQGQRAERMGQRPEYKERPERKERKERTERADRPERQERSDRQDRPDRPERPERPERKDRKDRYGAKLQKRRDENRGRKFNDRPHKSGGRFENRSEESRENQRHEQREERQDRKDRKDHRDRKEHRGFREDGQEQRGDFRGKPHGKFGNKSHGKPYNKSKGKPHGKFERKSGEEQRSEFGDKPAHKHAGKPHGKPSGKPGGKYSAKGGKPSHRGGKKPFGKSGDAAKRYSPSGGDQKRFRSAKKKAHGG